MTTDTLRPVPPAVGAHVEMRGVTWEVSAHESDSVVVLTRYGMDPDTDYDRVMGNGRCPDYGTVTVRFELTSSGSGEVLTETFTESR